MKPSGKSFLQTVLAPLISISLLLVVWQLAILVFKLHPIILPPPLSVLKALWVQREVLFRATCVTGGAALAGLGCSILFGSLLAVLFSQSRWIRAACFPYVIFLQTVPIVAIAPLLIIWSGYNFRTIVIVSFIISLFPIVSNVTAGLISIDRNLLELFKLYHANRWQTLLRLRIPAAVSHLVLGARISSGLAVIGTIVGEFFVGNGGQYDGLGSVMTGWQSLQKTDALMAAIIVSTILGVAMFSIVNLLASTVLYRWTKSSGLDDAS